jgi:flagellar biosynthesis/type III secretory pathway protein FliH
LVHRRLHEAYQTSRNFTSSPPQQNVGQSDARRSNDHKVQNKREKAAFKRGYENGLKAAQVAGSSAINGAVQAAYDRGFSDGKHHGYAQGKRDGRNERPQSQQASRIDMDRLTSLFNMTLARGAAQGEVVAARKAAGRTIAKWIKEKFGQDVQVDVL